MLWERRKLVRSTSVGVTAGLLLVVGSAVAGSKVYVSVNAGGTILKIKPARIHLVSNENLSHLKWTSWDGKTARATGTDHGNGPNPDHKASNPVEVKATGRRQCGNRMVYTTILLHFTRGVPYAGQPHHTRFAYGCPR